MPFHLRWGNLARLAGVLLALALIVAWPRLAPSEPALPDREATPLADDVREGSGERPRGRGRRDDRRRGDGAAREERQAQRDDARRAARRRARREEARRERRRDGHRDDVARDERRMARREQASRRGEVPRNEVASGRGEVPRNEVASGPGGGVAPPSEPTVVPAPHVNETVGPAPAPDPAATEFGFEGG